MCIARKSWNRVRCNKKVGRLIPLTDIPLCWLTPARVGVEVVSGGARLNVLARAGAERRIPNLHVVALTLFLLVDVVTGALAVVRLVVLPFVAVLKAKRLKRRGGESSTKKNVNTSRARIQTRETCLKFCLSPALTHFAHVARKRQL